jgi:deazaflavin-dependent oxidoreductase (nitroreductase family)
MFVFASKAGAPTNPDWYHNLVAHPEVTVEAGAERFSARASVITGPERERIYAAHAADFPGFAEYQEKTDRIIPVVELERL